MGEGKTFPYKTPSFWDAENTGNTSTTLRDASLWNTVIYYSIYLYIFPEIFCQSIINKNLFNTDLRAVSKELI